MHQKFQDQLILTLNGIKLRKTIFLFYIGTWYFFKFETDNR